MKYKLTDETINHLGKTLYRIVALKQFADVGNGEKGGFVESDKNLDQSGNAWVGGNAWVYGNALVSGGKHICPPLYIQGSKHAITVNTVDIVNIGCKSMPISDWVKHYRAVGKLEHYNKKQVDEYGKYLMLIADILGVGLEGK